MTLRCVDFSTAGYLKTPPSDPYNSKCMGAHYFKRIPGEKPLDMIYE